MCSEYISLAVLESEGCKAALQDSAMTVHIDDDFLWAYSNFMTCRVIHERTSLQLVFDSTSAPSASSLFTDYFLWYAPIHK
jgi:hypothetical protein